MKNPPWIWFDGAVDWTVVRVVVSERTDGAGEENVLPSPPPWEPTAQPEVTAVPALELAASDMVVSAFVESVGAADFVPIVEACCSKPDSENDGSERERWLGRSLAVGSEKDR